VTETGEKSRMAQLVSRARVQMQQARTQYWSEASQGRLRQATLSDLRSSLLQYYDVLHEHKGEDCIKEKWDNNQFDRLPRMIHEEVPVESSTAGHGSGSQSETVPYIQTMSGSDLIEISYELDSVAKKLGFCAAVDEQTPTTEITQDKVREAEERARELREKAKKERA